MALAPDSAEPLNALGTLEGVRRQIRRSREILSGRPREKPESSLAARHNLGRPARQSKEPPERSHRSLPAESCRQFRIICRRVWRSPNCSPRAVTPPEPSNNIASVIAQTPEYLGARIALAGQLAESESARCRLEQLRAAVQAGRAECFPMGTDRRRWSRPLTTPTEAHEAYATALKLESENAGRKRLRAKMAF